MFFENRRNQSSSDAERERFIAEHAPFSKSELVFIRKHYSAIAIELLKWFDDCVLFALCYLTRRFWNRVARVGRREDEIWVTSFFNLGINALRPAKQLKKQHLKKQGPK